MVGQTQLIESLRGLIDSKLLPRTLLLEGPSGCGKHTLAYELAEYMHLTYRDITESLTLETLESIQLSPIPCMYIINASNISIKEQNTILKFLEEPLKTSYICVLVESKHRLLNTVLNRCYVRTFTGYSEDELLPFWKDSAIKSHPVAKYANTPGRILQMQDTDAVACWEMAHKVLQKTAIANYANILTIPSKFYYKESKDGLLDFELFAYLFSYAAKEDYQETKINFKQFELVRKFHNDLWIPNINKQTLFEHFLIEYKRITGGGS